MKTNNNPNSERNNQVINDFGAKIGGAHKDRAREAAERLAGVEASSLLTQPLSKVAKLPDLRGLYLAGVISADVARLAWYYWSQIGGKPGALRPKALQRWANQAAAIIAEVARLLAYGTAEKSQISGFLELDKPAQSWHLFTEEMNAANWPADEYKRGSYFVGLHWSHIAAYAIHNEKTSYSAKYNTVAECVEAIRAKVGEAAAKGGPKFSVYTNRAGLYFISPDGKPGIKLFEYANREEAFAAYADKEKLAARYNELRTFPSERCDWNRPRVGEDWRKGCDMSPEAFAQVFPFRGVEFGNWVNQLERAACLNEAADALQDLARVLGIVPAAVTLRGSLAFAFGSRGVGKALAHYEPARKVINLTKKKGNGCVAHEWFHALDNFLYVGAGCWGHCMIVADGADYGDAEKSPLFKAAFDLRFALQRSEMAKRSANIDAYRAKPYWGTVTEMAARAFEAVVYYKLEAAGLVNDYLVSFKPIGEYSRPECYPYPTKEEAAQLAPLFDALIAAAFGDAERLAPVQPEEQHAPADCAEERQTIAASEPMNANEEEPEAPANRGEGVTYGEAEKSQLPADMAQRLATGEALHKEVNAKHPGSVLLFRVGDFYASTFGDGERVADITGAPLRAGANGQAVAYFPFAALDVYLPKLVRAGVKICIADLPAAAPTAPAVDAAHPANEEPAQAPAAPSTEADAPAYGNTEKSQLPQVRPEVEALRQQARRAGAWTSFDPEKLGDALINELENDLQAFESQLPEEIRAEKVAAYIAKWREWLAARSRCISAAVTGPARFPVARAEKLNDYEQAAWQRLQDWAAKVIRRCNAEKRLTGWAEVERLTAKLEKLEQLQEAMKEANKIARQRISDLEKSDALVALGFSEQEAADILTPDYIGRIGFASFNLSNNLAKIKDIRAKIARHEALASQEDKTVAYQWGKLEYAFSDERYRLHFPGKPSGEILDFLKSHGWKWSRANGVWQRQITPAARYNLKQFIEKFGGKVEPSPEVHASEPMNEEPAEVPAAVSEGAPYGDAEKSQNFEDVAVSVPEVQEYKLMYLFGGWVCDSCVYAETDDEAIQDATDNYITSRLPRWPYRVALWEGSRLVHEFKSDGPDDIGRRDMEQEESENAPAYIVHDTAVGPFHLDDCATGSILAAVDRLAKNGQTVNPHPLQLLADGVKIWDSEDSREELARIVRQRLAL